MNDIGAEEVISQVSKPLADVNVSIMYVASLDVILYRTFHKTPSGWRLHCRIFTMALIIQQDRKEDISGKTTRRIQVDPRITGSKRA